jgi:CRISPR-associated endonuclease Cas1
MTSSVDSLRSGSRRSRGILTLTGYGLRVAVERGHLVVEDGIEPDRRRRRFSRAERGLKRLVIIGHSGTVTLDALQWLHDVGIELVHLGHDADLLVTTGPVGADLPKLRRAQATAALSGVALVIAKDLIADKLAGQEGVLHQIPSSEVSRKRIAATRAAVPEAATDEQLRRMEMTAARTYWDSWDQVEVRFTTPGRSRIPEHWNHFGSRLSLISGTGRRASNPANAILNYLYAILEAEARLAAMAVGLDPGLGLFHADTRSRHSLACDLMEPVRPAVDAFLLDLLRQRRFNRRAFFEVRDGGCRLLPLLTRELSRTASEWARKVAPVAERVATKLLAAKGPAGPGETLEGRWRSKKRPERFPTPLTGWNRKVGQAGPNGGPSHQDQRRTDLTRSLEPVPGLAVVASSIGEANKRRALTESHPTIRWEEEQLPPVPDLDARDPVSRRRFVKELLPHLRRLTTSELAEATGLSKGYCARIRLGSSIPNPRHWEALRQAACARQPIP